jgi:hypothetical protein
MTFKIGDIRANLRFGGARPTHFQISLTSPFDSDMDQIAPFMVSATQIPSSSINAIPVPYFGRKIQVAGNRTFAEWQVTVLNDEDFKIRNALEKWHNSINSLSGNLNTTGSAAPANYKSQGSVKQFGISDESAVIREYKFYGIFPTQISTIDLDWNATDQIEMFQVTFAYDWFDIPGGATGIVQ